MTPHCGHPRLAVAFSVAVPTEVQRDFLFAWQDRQAHEGIQNVRSHSAANYVFHDIGLGDGDCGVTAVQRHYNGSWKRIPLEVVRYWRLGPREADSPVFWSSIS
jgi:hypothetical protein